MKKGNEEIAKAISNHIENQADTVGFVGKRRLDTAEIGRALQVQAEAGNEMARIRKRIALIECNMALEQETLNSLRADLASAHIRVYGAQIDLPLEKRNYA